jgi:ribosomal protein L11 methyltransferase
VLRLDPGLVFGSGLHPTTRHCLELLLRRAALGPLGRVLDLGCGTGILGLAAALLGAEAVLAVDLNPLCVSTTQHNARLNGLALEVVEGQAQDHADRPAEVVLANLHWPAQQAVLARLELGPAAKDLILSGLMRSQRHPLEARLTELGCAIWERREAEDTWFTLWARWPGASEV